MVWMAKNGRTTDREIRNCYNVTETVPIMIIFGLYVCEMLMVVMEALSKFRVDVCVLHATNATLEKSFRSRNRSKRLNKRNQRNTRKKIVELKISWVNEKRGEANEKKRKQANWVLTFKLFGAIPVMYVFPYTSWH